MSHGEKLLLVVFIIGATAEPPTDDVAYIAWRVITIVIGVAFANWHSYRGKNKAEEQPPAAVG